MEQTRYQPLRAHRGRLWLDHERLTWRQIHRMAEVFAVRSGCAACLPSLAMAERWCDELSVMLFAPPLRATLAVHGNDDDAKPQLKRAGSFRETNRLLGQLLQPGVVSMKRRARCQLRKIS